MMVEASTISINIEDLIDLDALDDNISKQMRDYVIHEMRVMENKNFHKMCTDAIQGAINDRLAAIIEEKLNKPIKSVDAYGDLTGEPEQTLDEMIKAAANANLIEYVDNDGKKVASRTTGQYGGGRNQTRLEWLVQKVAAQNVERATLKACEQVNKEAVESAKEITAKAIAKFLAEEKS